MGSDSAKTHESYTVAPATSDPDLGPDADTPPFAANAEAAAHLPADPTNDQEPPDTAVGQPVVSEATSGEAVIADALHTPLIAVPDTAPTGDPTGQPLLVGGADLEDAAATLLAYDDAVGPREALHATVTAQAEVKLLEAIALADEHKVAVTVDKDVHGRLPLDETHQLFDQVQTLAKSVNHHLKAGDAIPSHTHEGHAKLVAALDTLEADPARTDAEQAMLAHYRVAAEQLGERLAPGYDVAYDAGGKVPTLTAHEVASTVQVTEMVPAPTAEPPEGLRAARTRRATRIKPTLENGHASWDGKARSTAAGHEYVIDLGDGYTAVYRPHTAADGKQTPAYSQRGALEVLAPPGAGHGGELVTRLGRVNLVNRAMSQAEGEWAYLTRNIAAQRLKTHPQVGAALAAADGLEDATYHQLWTARADEAVGMDESQLADFGRHLLLESEARALTHKVRLVRDAVAAATGHADGQALADNPGYDPTPTRAGGWLQWNRFDVAADPAKVDSAFGKRGLVHRVRGGDLLSVLQSGGVLASTERRRLMGVKSGVGTSESADMDTGGAQSVFLRVGGKPSSEPSLYWDDPARLLARADWYGYDGDHFGAVNPKAHQYSATKLTREPSDLAGFSSGANEVMFHHGIDLLGPQAPSRIVCGSPGLRSKVLSVLAARGLTHLDGRPIEEVVQP